MKIHFVGIGGIGISGLAKFLHAKGHTISGSDIYKTILTKELTHLGMTVNVPHHENAISDQELVVYSAVVPATNVEIVKAKELGIKVISRAEFLPFVLGKEKVYAVAGAHGKSTTTAILAQVLNNASTIIGAKSKAINSNMYYEKDAIVAFEADESDASFLNANAHTAIVINAEPEHMEFYGYDEEKFYDSYRQFMNNAKKRVINAEDPFLQTYEADAIRLYPSKDIKNIAYDLIKDEPYTRFELKDLGTFHVWGFGEHIALDASLAILAAQQECNIEEIRDNIISYKGIEKRFDIINKTTKHVIIDDYGHHPTEIKATMESIKTYARLLGFSDIHVIWQPHKYSRTVDNLEGFKACFEGASSLTILPVWRAGESIVDIDFANEFKQYENLTLCEHIGRELNSLTLMNGEKVLKTLDEGLIVGFGAGDITYQLRGKK
jgi:UDP-N-acetylmuramate--alanine ligase